MTTKVLFIGKTHNVNGRDGSTKSSDGFLDLKIPMPHPAAEDMFSAAWSACFMGAIEVAAARKKIALPPEMSIDAEIKLNLDGDSFFLSAQLDVSIPGIERHVAEELVHAAHGICPYSKATHGNIAVKTNVV